jgi:hypothetical protein
VQIEASGFRHSKSLDEIEVTLGGIRVPVVSVAPAKHAGMDDLTIEVPEAIRDLGEADLLCRVGRRVCNAVQIQVAGKPAS